MLKNIDLTPEQIKITNYFLNFRMTDDMQFRYSNIIANEKAILTIKSNAKIVFDNLEHISINFIKDDENSNFVVTFNYFADAIYISFFLKSTFDSECFVF